MANSQDQALIMRCRRGDRRALEDLIENHEKPVYNAAYRILGNPNDAADVTQSVFLKVFERLDRYNPEFKLFSWIYRITVNESINCLRRNNKQQPLGDKELAASGNPESVAVAGDISREVQKELMGLKENYRIVVVLRHFSECSYQQISDILQIPEKTVKSRLYSARQLMREGLQAPGLH